MKPQEIIIDRFPVDFPWWPPPSVAAGSLHPVGCSHSPRVSPPESWFKLSTVGGLFLAYMHTYILHSMYIIVYLHYKILHMES